MRFAFIGGTRFIGAAAVRRALDLGHEVHVLHRGEHPNPDPRARVVAVDRGDVLALRRALQSVCADAVVDTRAMTEADARGTLDASDAPLCVLSSQDVYAQFGALLGHPAPPPRERIDEESPLTVHHPYRHIEGQHGDADYDKKDVERVFRQGVSAQRLEGATLLRLAPTYGFGDPSRRFGEVVDALEEGDGTLPHRGCAQWRWTRAHVDDVAVAIVMACEARANREGPAFRIYNVGEPEAWTMRRWCEGLAAFMGKVVTWAETAELPDALRQLGEMPNDVVVDSRRIRDELGYKEVTTPERRIADIVGWARASRGT